MQDIVYKDKYLYNCNAYKKSKEELFKQFEDIMERSLITSFGLDFIFNDRHGGDVDTIHNVRKIGEDSLMEYKNPSNEMTYVNRPKYDHKDVEKDFVDKSGHKRKTNYRQIKSNAKKAYKENNKNTVTDAYTGKPLHFLGKAKGHPTDKAAHLDHVISANEIYNDRGRVLADVSLREMADISTNLQWTNEHLNTSMGNKSIKQYIEEHPELSDADKQRMLKADKKARSTYEKILNKKYYSSKKFKLNLITSAGKSGIKMGVRQAAGLFFYELWVAVKDVIKHSKCDSLKSIFVAISNGIKKGYKRIKLKYKEIFTEFIDGGISGILSNLLTSMINIFFTTSQNIVCIIRQVFPSIVEAGKIIFINPQNYNLKERIHAALKVLATGAGLASGILVGEMISLSGIGEIPIWGDIFTGFCSAFVTGIVTCGLVYMIDNSTIINTIINKINNLTLGNVADYYNMQAEYWDKYAAELLNYDLKKLKDEINDIYTFANKLNDTTNVETINTYLEDYCHSTNISKPWIGNFNDFMKDKKAHLIFE